MVQTRVGALLVAAGLALVGGCLAADDPSLGGEEPATEEGPASFPLLHGSAQPEVPVLGIAVYQGIPAENVEPHMPGSMDPTPCLFPDTQQAGTVDVWLIVTEERFPALPDRPGETHHASMTLATCSPRPEGLARGDANEPPFVNLVQWMDGDAYAAFLEELRFPPEPASVDLEGTLDGYRFTVEGETEIAQGAFATPGVGIPAFPETSCEPVEMIGRVIAEGADGRLGAMDWNKTEAICPAESAIQWPMDGVLAEIVGPSRTPDIVVDMQVQRADYAWRTLTPP